MKKISKNKGSALVSVLVVIAFISILATTLLYVSGVNYQLKMSDNKTKVSFYETEESVDQIRADIVRLASETEKEIYPEMLACIGNCINDSDLQLKYQKLFFDKMGTKVSDYLNTKGLTAQGVVFDDNASASPRDCVYVRNIEVKQTTSNGYYSFVSTDIVIEAPVMVWPHPDADDSSSAGEKVDYFKCVYYTNWVKK